MQVRQRVYYQCYAIRWYFNDKFHRYVDLPSQYYFSNRKLIAAYYSQHGKVHRTTGSAVIYYRCKIKKYYYEGRRYGNLEEMQMMEACR